MVHDWLKERVSWHAVPFQKYSVPTDLLGQSQNEVLVLRGHAHWFGDDGQIRPAALLHSYEILQKDEYVFFDARNLYIIFIFAIVYLKRFLKFKS